ncbi:MAG: CPBP family intramembrane metalloprotease [Lachnospiraceae bacterium]|nr:CPBP family intramembrane metalloprotease [Lachnospiraceae bacterium]
MKRIFDDYVKRRTAEELHSRSSLHRTFYILIPILIYYLLGDVVDIALWALINAIVADSETKKAFVAVHASDFGALIYGVSAIFFILILSRMAKEEILYVNKEENPKKMGFRDYVEYAVAGFSSALFLNMLFRILRITELSGRFSETFETQRSVTFSLGILIYAFVSPVTEEILFRGIVYNRMRRLFPVRVAVIVTSLLFGVFHGNPVQGIYGALMGLLITYAYEKTRNFTVPVLIHIAANVIVYSLTYNDILGAMSMPVFLTILILLGAVFALSIYRLFIGNKEWK